MARMSRAARMAGRLLQEGQVASAPIPVEELAESHAHVVRKELPEDVSGMLVPLSTPTEERGWAIVVNAAHAPVRQRFTVAHELGHLLLHRYTAPHADGGFRVRFRDTRSSIGSVREEIEANRFAAELLMPRDLVLSLLAKLQFDYAPRDEDDKMAEKLRPVAKKLGVSVEALSLRIAHLVESEG